MPTATGWAAHTFLHTFLPPPEFVSNNENTFVDASRAFLDEGTFAALSPHGVIVESQSDRVPLEVPVRPGCGQWPDAQNRVLRDQNSTACRPARARFAGSTRLRVSHGEAPSNLLHQPLHSEREWPHPSQEASRLPVAAGEHTHVAPPAGICRPCPTRSSDLLLLHPVSERGRTGVFSDTEQHALCWIHLSTVPDLCASSTFAKSHRLTI